VLVSILILINLLIGSSLVAAQRSKPKPPHKKKRCQLLKLDGFKDRTLNGEWPKLRGVHEDDFPVYEQPGGGLYMFRFEKVGADGKPKKHYAIGPDYEGLTGIVMQRKGTKSGVQCKKCQFVDGTGQFVDGMVGCGKKQEKLMMMSREKTDASAMMEADAVTAESASASSSGDFMLMAAGAAVGALLVAVAVAVVVAMRKRKSAKRTEMEMTEAVHVPDSSVMTPDATEKKAEGDEDAVTVHSSHAAEVTVSVSMDDEAVQVEA